MKDSPTIPKETKPCLRPVTDLLGQDISRKQDWQGPAEAILNLQGKPANAVWTCQEFTKLCQHLHNDNGSTRYIMGFNKDGEKKYVRSKTLLSSKAISWAWSTINGRSKSGLAFVPYSMNQDKLSRWCAWDFDAHDGNRKRANDFALAAFRRLLGENLFLILESSGQGWHLWAIAKDFHPVQDWVRLLKDVARFIGAPIEPGVCEIFPPDTLATGLGKGMRVPGSWNPGTGTINEIFWENTQVLLSHLSPADLRDIPPQLTDIERNLSFSSSSAPLYREWERNWFNQYSIKTVSTRNDQLSGLVGEMFHQVGRTMAGRLVEAQFNTKAVATKATLADHQYSFSLLWDGLREKWLATLTDRERSQFRGLTTETERDGFRIVRGYHRYSEAQKQADFPIAVENLGERLGLTKQGASEMRKKFVAVGILELTLPYRPNKTAARYKWLLVDEKTPSAGGQENK